MFEWLDNLFSEPKDSARQLEQAKAKSRTYPASAEKRARELGYRNAESMYEFQRQKSQRREVQTTAVGSTAKRGVEDAISAHPASIFDHIAEVLRKANNKE